ncbi:MAG: hypothetical protein DMF90_00325 [Acidobacteria bacterium]|nr:MAG: hypothetical protein DMF90_00325 [Acidobacteriota bacterium]
MVASMTRTAMIVGAGIGGLSSALALRQAGWHVRVFERAASGAWLRPRPRTERDSGTTRVGCRRRGARSQLRAAARRTAPARRYRREAGGVAT